MLRALKVFLKSAWAFLLAGTVIGGFYILLLINMLDLFKYLIGKHDIVYLLASVTSMAVMFGLAHVIFDQPEPFKKVARFCGVDIK